ncbi:inosose dehydratase [Micromonospora pallida]|uniref:Inosose dehydratase n=1 Tax=Micromonospora pallida TaxID=145854 RepID=A0A1C6SHM3_9ACTN|nr:sugar phosphate isomerase/epimerase [Micromonospora pallida]SCL28957.1 inosose dehydratase [Micromonospora pallida]
MGETTNIRFGTDIITFFDTAWWGLGEELPYPDWIAAVGRDPRHYFDRMLDGVRDAGLEGVELAPEPGGWTTALKAYGDTAGVKRALAERGLVLSSSYAPGRQLIGDALDDPDREAHADRYMDEHAAFVAELGADIITMGNIARSRFKNESPDDTATAEDFTAPVSRELHERFAEQVNRLGAIVGRHGVRIAIHTDAYSVCSRNEDIATVLELTDPETVLLCPDAGHISLDGGDPVEVLRRHLDRIPVMHWKDCAQPLSGHVLRGDQKQRHATMLTYFRVLGSGKVDWTRWMEILRDNEWRGWAIEEIDNSPDPVGELRQGLEYFRTHLAPIYR